MADLKEGELTLAQKQLFLAHTIRKNRIKFKVAIDYLAQGHTIQEAKTKGLIRSPVKFAKACATDPVLKEYLKNAVDSVTLRWIFESVDIIDDDSLDIGFADDGKPFVNGQNIQRSKARAEVRLKAADQLDKRFGEKTPQTQINNFVVAMPEQSTSEEEWLKDVTHSATNNLEATTRTTNTPD